MLLIILQYRITPDTWSRTQSREYLYSLLCVLRRSGTCNFCGGNRVIFLSTFSRALAMCMPLLLVYQRIMYQINITLPLEFYNLWLIS